MTYCLLLIFIKVNSVSSVCIPQDNIRICENNRNKMHESFKGRVELYAAACVLQKGD